MKIYKAVAALALFAYIRAEEAETADDDDDHEGHDHADSDLVRMSAETDFAYIANQWTGHYWTQCVNATNVCTWH